MIDAELEKALLTKYKISIKHIPFSFKSKRKLVVKNIVEDYNKPTGEIKAKAKIREDRKLKNFLFNMENLECIYKSNDNNSNYCLYKEEIVSFTKCIDCAYKT